MLDLLSLREPWPLLPSLVGPAVAAVGLLLLAAATPHEHHGRRWPAAARTPRDRLRGHRDPVIWVAAIVGVGLL